MTVAPGISAKNQLKQIAQFAETLTLDEKRAMKSMLSGQIDAYFDKENRLDIHDTHSANQFHALAQTFRELSMFPRRVPTNGIAYYGKPDWLTQDLLLRLQLEADARRDQPLDRTDHFLGCGGREADKLSISSSLTQFVAAHSGEAIPTGIASYIYYDRPGLGIRPHVDTDVFAINVMLMLRHDCRAEDTPSATVVFPSYGDPEYYRLQVGEVMIMFGSSVIHTRTMVQKAESIHLLTMGFNPI